MTEPATTHPASYCPDAAHTLQWGLHPDSSTQGWILRRNDDGGSVVAVLDGYPHGRPPVPASEAREWADRILGTAQGWVEQPAQSGAYHQHNTVVAAPGAALNSTPDPQPDRSHRTVLAVTVTSRPDGGHYIDQADFTAHVAQWLKTDLKGHHAIDQVTVDDQADDAHRLALSTALGLGTSAPWDAIRERAAEAEAPLSPDYEHPDCGFHWHGSDGMDIPMRDGQPVCPRCELRKVEKQLRHSDKRREELRVESLRRGRNVLEQSEKIRALERQIDSIREQLGAEILRAGQAEDELRRLAAETPGPETQGGPRFVRVCTACPVCDHTVDENGACENGCRTPAVVAEPGKEG